MTEPLAAIYADFVDTRRVKTRKVLQIILEVSLEQEPEIMRALGWPNPAISLPVAIARLKEPQNAGGAQRSAIESSPPTPQDVAGDTPVPVKKAKAFKDRSRSQQAALKLQDPSFCLWLADEFARKYPDSVPDEDANENLLTCLGINSKTRLDVQGSQDARAWDALLTSYDTRAYIR